MLDQINHALVVPLCLAAAILIVILAADIVQDERRRGRRRKARLAEAYEQRLRDQQRRLRERYDIERTVRYVTSDGSLRMED